jgi:glutamine phosphoribosylpyrophosphate amidotransferase
MYLVFIDNLNYSETFNKTSQFLRYQFDKQEMNKLIEKNTIRWVSMDTLLVCIENEQRNAPISLRGVFYTTLVNCKDQLQLIVR